MALYRQRKVTMTRLCTISTPRHRGVGAYVNAIKVYWDAPEHHSLGGRRQDGGKGAATEAIDAKENG